MAESGKGHTPIQDSDAAICDVMVKLPARKKISAISPLALQAAGIPEKYLDHLLRLLATGEMAKVKGSVTDARAREIAQRFTRAGLEVAITPAMTVYTIIGDGQETCPACGHRVTLPENRQCPQCHAFVDKISAKFLAKRRKEERARAEREAKASNARADKVEHNRIAALEEEFHTKILRELGPKYRLVRRFRPLYGKSRWLRLAIGTALVGGVFAAGYVSSMIVAAALRPPPEADSVTENSVVVALRNKLVQLGVVDTPKAPPGDPISVALPANALLRGPQGQRITLRGLGLEHAIEATLASPAAGAQSAPPSVTLAMPLKIRLATQFAQTLTELGQLPRAQDLVRALKDTPELAHEPAAAALLRQTEIETQGWALLALPEARARNAINKLLPQIGTLPDAVAKVHSMSRMALVLSRHAQLAGDVPRDILAQATTLGRAITDGNQRNAALGNISVAQGEILARDIESRAHRGLQATTTAAQQELAQLTKGAPDAWSRARLLALEGRVFDLLGDRDKARERIEATFAAVEKYDDVAEQIASLRALMRYLPGTARVRLQALAGAMPAKLDALPARDKAQAALQLSLLHADLGTLPAAEQYANVARTTGGLTTDESNAISAEAIMQREFATVRALHTAGRYADADAALRRITGYLL